MGIKKNALKVTDGAIRRIIDEYTMESGVRDLKKLINTLCRTAAVQLVKMREHTRQSLRQISKNILGKSSSTMSGNSLPLNRELSPDLHGPERAEKFYL